MAVVVEWTPPGLDVAVLRSVIERLSRIEASMTALLVTGSYARGAADPLSDLDLTAIVGTSPDVSYRTWFEDRGAAPPLHVSAGIKTEQSWLEGAAHPAGWSLGFPAVDEARFVWGAENVSERLGDPPSAHHPPGEPELEDFVESMCKVARTSAQGDGAGLRWYAREAGALAPVLLLGLNDLPPVRTPREALESALSLGVAPEHYREDIGVVLGVESATDKEVTAAALRLAIELLRFLRLHHPDVDPQPDLIRYLADGTLEHHIEAAVRFTS